MIGSINFGKPQNGSGDIVNSIIKSYKARTKTVSADTFVDFVNNNITYIRNPSTIINNNQFSYFYVQTVKINNDVIFVLHSSDTTNSNVQASLVVMDRTGSLSVKATTNVSSNYESGSNLHAILVNNNQVFVTYTYGDGSSFLAASLLSVTCSRDLNLYSITVENTQVISNSSGSSMYTDLVLLNTNKVFLVHNDANAGLMAPIAHIVTIANNSFTYTTGTYVTDVEQTYEFTRACLVDENKVLVTHADGSQDRNLKATICNISNNTITPGINTVLRTSAYAAQDSQCISMGDGKVIITYDEADTLNAMLVEISETDIEILSSINVWAGEGSYSHKLLKLNDSTAFVTYCSDIYDSEWNYNLIYINNKTLTLGTQSTFTSGTESLGWPTGGSTAMNCVALSENRIFIAFANSNMSLSGLSFGLKQEEVTLGDFNLQYEGSHHTKSGSNCYAIKYTPDTVYIFYVYDYTTGGTTYTDILAYSYISIEKDGTMHFSSVTHPIGYNKDVIGWIDSIDRGVVLEEGTTIFNTKMIILCHKKGTDSTDRQLCALYFYDGYIRVLDLSSVSQYGASNNIYKLSDTKALITYTTDSTNNTLSASIVEFTDSAPYFNILNTTQISSLSSSAWMHHYVDMGSYGMFFFRNNTNNSMYIDAASVIIDLENNTITVNDTYSIIHQREAAMCIRGAKIDDNRILLLHCIYDSEVGQWGAWYLGASIITMYKETTTGVEIKVSVGTATQLSQDSGSENDECVISLGNEQFIVTHQDIDGCLVAQRVNILVDKILFDHDILIDSSESSSMSNCTIKLSSTRLLAVHGYDFINMYMRMQDVWVPNRVGTFIEPTPAMDLGDVLALSKDNIDADTDGEVYVLS